MKKTIAIIMASVLALSVLSGITIFTMNCKANEEMKTGNMKVCGLVSPIGIDTVPVFSWENTGTGFGRSMTAYRVIVSQNKNNADKKKGDMWDSGKTESKNNFDISYGGTELASRTEYFWRVGIWDENGRETWSETASFETGILNFEEWHGAEWITADVEELFSLKNVKWIWRTVDNFSKIPMETVCFRKTIEINKPVKNALLGVTADDSFSAYINDEKRISAENWRSGDFTDVTADIKQGTNVIAVSAKNFSEGNGGLAGKLKVTYTDGTNEEFITDDTWKVSLDSVSGWEKSDFNDSSWENAKAYGNMGMSPWGNVSLKFRRADGIRNSPMLRKEFEVSKNIRRARAYFTGLGMFEMKINGVLPDDSVLNPANTQYEIAVNYRVFDITGLLSKGANAVSVELGNGFYHELRHPNQYWTGDPVCMGQIVIDYTDGTTEMVVSDTSWKATVDGPMTFNDIFLGENYDARLEKDDWEKVGYDDSLWKNAVKGKAPGKNGKKSELRFENMEPMRRIKTFKDVTVTKHSSGSVIVELPVITTGWARITFKNQNAGNRIHMIYGESLYTSGEKEGHVKPVSHWEDGFVFQEYYYTCKGGESETYEPKFCYAGYKYIEIEGLTGEFSAEDIECYLIANDVEETFTFETDNELVNTLHEIFARTLINNFQGKPTDCPTWEKLGWTGDYDAVVKSINYNYNINNFNAKYFADMRDASIATGNNEIMMAPTYAPSGEAWHNVPTWNAAYIDGLYENYRSYGNLTLIKDHWEQMDLQAMSYINQLKSDKYFTGKPKKVWLWYDNIGLDDWQAPDGTNSAPEGCGIIGTATVYRCLEEMCYFARLLGKNDRIPVYEDAMKNIYRAFNDEYFDKESGHYETGFWNAAWAHSREKYRQTNDLTAIAYGLCPEEYKQSVLSSLVEKIKKNGYHLNTGFFGTKLILPVLAENGYMDVAWKILTQTTYPSWGYWVSLGATTCWEDYNDKTVRSRDHYFLGSYDQYLYENILGIADYTDGYSEFTVDPDYIGDIKKCSGTVKTVRGILAVNWDISEKREKISVTVPVGSKATVYLPESSLKAVTVNGKLPEKQAGIISLEEENGRIKVIVGSGEYNFVCGTETSIPVSGEEVSRLITSEGLVLLKNRNNALPLKNGAKIALFGEGQADRYQQGSGIDTLTYQAGFVAFGAGSSKAMGKNGTVAPLDAFRQAQTAGEGSIYEPLSQKYETEELTVTKDTNDANRIARFDLNYTPDDAMIDSAAGFADTAIVFISRWGGECRDFSKGQWYLTDSEKALLKSASAKFDKVIVILNTSNAIDTSWAFENSDGIDVDAVLFAGYPGVQGGLAIADIILGKTNPSGKLTFTFAKDINDYPTTESFLKQPEQEYTEDIFLGYRYFETFNKEVNFPFGFGLSYTQFKTEKESFSVEGDTVTVKVKVTNIGNVTGKEVVQLYFSAPQGVLGKAAKELCAFKKTRALAPGGSEVLTLTFNKNDMAAFDDLGKTGNKSAYVLEAGDYKVFAGNSVKNVSEAGVVTVNELTVVEQLSSQCPSNLTKRLLADGSFEEIEQTQNTYVLNNEVTVEAEDYIDKGYGSEGKKDLPKEEGIGNGYLYNPVTKKYESGYSGKAMAHTYPKDAYLVYRIEVKNAGEYLVSARIASAESGSIGFAVSTNKNDWSEKTSVTFINTQADSGNTSSYYNLRDFYADRKITLSEGVNYIKISDMQAGHPNIDSFRIEDAKSINEIDGKITVDVSDYTKIYGEQTLGSTVYKTHVKSYGGCTLYNETSDAYEGTYTWNVLENMWCGGNAYVIYKINAASAGQYKLSMRTAVKVLNSDVKNFIVSVSNDGKNFGDEITTSSPLQTDGFYKFRDGDAAVIELTQGTNYIKFTKGVGINLTQFSLTAVPEQIEDIVCSVKDYVEIYGNYQGSPRTAVHSREGYIYSPETDTYGEKQTLSVLEDMWCSGAYVTYRVRAEKSGTYRMSFMAASQDGSTSPFIVTCAQDKDMNSVAGSFTMKNVAATGNFYKFKEITDDSYLIPLKKGDNYIRLTKGVSVNLTSFTFTFVLPSTELDEPGDRETYYQLADVINGKVSMNDFVAQMKSDELASFFVSYAGKGAGSAGASDAVCQKYGFARFNMSDGPAGLGSAGTAFPSETVIACTWNTQLVRAYATVIGAEAAELRIDMWLAPGMNLHRNPLGGRDNEYFSEDPYVTGVFGSEIVRCLQSYGVGVCIKHFICNEKEGSKLQSDSRVSERALRELYLKPFEMTVKNSQPLGVMTSYNIVNGTAASENSDLLKGILRGEWGYSGIICGDWNNDKSIVNEINGGLTLRNPAGSCDVNVIVNAYKKGEISRETLESGAKAMLYTLMRMQSFASTANSVCGGDHYYINGVCNRCRAVDRQKVNSFEYELGALLYGNAYLTGNLDVGATLDMNYYAYINCTPENELTLKIRRKGAVTETLSGINEDGRVKFTLKSITPQSMAENITVELFDGDDFICARTGSIKNYCNRVVEAGCSKKEKTFMADMLLYGQAFSDYKNLNANIADADWIEESKTDFEKIKSSLVSRKSATASKSETSRIKSAGLYFSNFNKIYFRTENRDSLETQMLRNGVPVETEYADSKYYTDGIKATEFDDTYTFMLKSGGETVHEVTYSVNSYVLSKCDGSENINVLARALGCYGYSAKMLAQTEKTKKIVCVGDSLTEGDYGIYKQRSRPNVHSENYPYFLAKYLNAETVNLGKCGDNPIDTLVRLKGDGNLKNRIGDADAVLIMLGTNGNLDPNVSADNKWNTAYKDLVTLLKSAAPDAKIVILTSPRVTENPAYSNYDKNVIKYVSNAQKFAKTFAESNGYALIDVGACEDFSSATEAKYQANDGLHFVREGYLRLAQFVGDRLEHIL